MITTEAILCLNSTPSTPSFQLPCHFGLGNRLISIEAVNCVALELLWTRWMSRWISVVPSLAQLLLKMVATRDPTKPGCEKLKQVSTQKIRSSTLCLPSHDPSR